MYKKTYQSAAPINTGKGPYDPSLEATKEKLRKLRTEKCYSVVNRGRLWYNRLTVEQYAELEIWYQKWLDVTDTLIIPEEPIWLNDKLETEEIL